MRGIGYDGSTRIGVRVGMKNRDVVRDIRGFAAARRVRVTSHGRKRMSERGVTYADLRHGLMSANDCEEGANSRWRILAPRICPEIL